MYILNIKLMEEIIYIINFDDEGWLMCFVEWFVIVYEEEWNDVFDVLIMMFWWGEMDVIFYLFRIVWVLV